MTIEVRRFIARSLLEIRLRYTKKGPAKFLPAPFQIKNKLEREFQTKLNRASPA
jgi:hypothetical protein